MHAVGGVDGGPGRLAVAEVGGHEGPAVGQRVLGLPAGAHHDRGAGVGEALGDAPAHALGAARDQHGLPGQIDLQRHESLFLLVSGATLANPIRI